MGRVLWTVECFLPWKEAVRVEEVGVCPVPPRPALGPCSGETVMSTSTAPRLGTPGALPPTLVSLGVGLTRLQTGPPLPGLGSSFGRGTVQVCLGRVGAAGNPRTPPSQGRSPPTGHPWVGGCGAENGKPGAPGAPGASEPLWPTATSSVQGVHHHRSSAAARGGVPALGLSPGSLGDCAWPLGDLGVHVHKSRRLPESRELAATRSPAGREREGVAPPGLKVPSQVPSECAEHWVLGGDV